MKVKQLSAVLDDQSDNLAILTKTLSSRGVDITAMNVTKSGKFTVARMIVNNVLWATSALWEAGFTANLSDVLAAEIPPEPEGLAKVFEVLEDLGISVKYMYTVKNAAVLRLSDNAVGESVFEHAGIKLLTQGELSAL